MKPFLLPLVIIGTVPFIFNSGFDQGPNTRIDSLKQLIFIKKKQDKARLLHELAYIYERTDLDSSLHYAHRLEEWSIKADHENWLAKAQTRKASVYHSKLQYDSAIHYAQSAVLHFKNMDSLKAMLRPLQILGFAYEDIGQYDQSLEQYFTTLQITERLGDKTRQALTLNQIGNSYRMQKDGLLAVQYLIRAHRMIMNIEEGKQYRPMIVHNLALAYDKAGKKEEAVGLFKSIFSLDEARVRSMDSSRIFTNIARVYIMLQHYDSAMKYLDAGKHIRKKLNNPSHSAYAYKEYATLYRELGQYDKAIEYGLMVDKIGKETGEFLHIEDAYHNLRDAYYAAGDYKNSADYAIKFSELLTKIYNEEKQELIHEMETKYQTAQKEKAIEKLEAEKVIDQKTKALLGSVVATTLLILILLRYAYKKQKAQKQLAQTQLLLSQAALESKKQELNHFVEILREKNKVLEQLENQLATSAICKQEKLENIDKLTKSIILTEDDWQDFKIIFESVHQNFFTKLRNEKPDLTDGEMRLAALMKLNLSTKEISSMLGISSDSVTKAKYRFKQKMNMEKGKELEGFVMSI